MHASIPTVTLKARLTQPLWRPSVSSAGNRRNQLEGELEEVQVKQSLTQFVVSQLSKDFRLTLEVRASSYSNE